MLRTSSYAVLFVLVAAGQTPAPAAAADTIVLPGQTSSGNTFDVTAYGAVGNGVADDTPAIQRAINAAAKAAGGGTVYFPARTYLLNSHYPSRHPWMFYNLVIGSNVTLSGKPGANFFKVRMAATPFSLSATEVRNTVLAFGPEYTTIRFQNTSLQRRFLPAAGNARRRHYGDSCRDAGRIAFRERRLCGDLCPGSRRCHTDRNIPDRCPWMLQRAFSASNTPLARSFSTPFDRQRDVLGDDQCRVKNLIVQGTEPLAVTETFGFTAQNNQFLIDCSVGGGNVTGLNLNTLNGFRFIGNLITCVGPSFSILELPQRNSQNGCLEGNTFRSEANGHGRIRRPLEIHAQQFHAAPRRENHGRPGHRRLRHRFQRQHVQGGNLTGGGGFGSLIADYWDRITMLPTSARSRSSTIRFPARPTAMRVWASSPRIPSSREIR